MRLHMWAGLAAMMLLTACETASDDTGSAAGDGAALGGDMVGGNAGMGMDQSALSAQQDLAQNVGDRVFFATDRSDLTQEARDTLSRQAAWMMRYPNVSITIEGHADERGTREYNLALGERRATAAMNYLVALGVPADRVQTVSFGKERPAVDGHTEAAWAQNRRSVTVVAGGAPVN